MIPLLVFFQFGLYWFSIYAIFNNILTYSNSKEDVILPIYTSRSQLAIELTESRNDIWYYMIVKIRGSFNNGYFRSGQWKDVAKSVPSKIPK